MTGDLLKAMRHCPQPIVAAVDGVCAGAGAILAMGADLRLGTPRARVSFLFVRVGLSGADMGACAILPRIVGQGRASELLYTGAAWRRRGRALGFLQSAGRAGQSLHAGGRGSGGVDSAGPTFAHADDQADAPPGVEHVQSTRRSRRRPRLRRCAWRPTTSAARTRRFRPRLASGPHSGRLSMSPEHFVAPPRVARCPAGPADICCATACHRPWMPRSRS